MTNVINLDSIREARLARDPFTCVHAEARPGLLLIHVPEGWTHVELTPQQARIWLEQLAQLVDSAEALEGEHG
jgi:hypothetical protein